MLNQRGFTLAELITSAAITAILMLVAASLLFFMNYSYLSKRDRMEAELAAARAELMLKLVFSQAVNVQAANPADDFSLTGNGIPAYVGANNPGRVAFGIYDRIRAPLWTKIAAFQREIQAGTAVNFGSIARTAIWFRRPVAPATTGVLFIDMGTRLNAGLQPAPANMQPSYADDYIPRISYLEIVPTATVNYGQMASLEFRMRFRYHNKSNQATTWCPRENLPGGAAPIGACNVAGAQWQDIDRRFTILLRNNLIRTAGNASRAGVAGAVEDRVLGNLYFFHPVLPGLRP